MPESSLDPTQSPIIPTDAFVADPYGPELTEETLTVQRPRAGEVLIEVAACGVCHTDLHVLKDEVAFPKPAVLGHEVTGIVREVGDGVTRVAAGDRVACSFIMPCGSCRHCERGREDLCETFFAKNRLNGHLYDDSTRFARSTGEPIAMYSMGGHSQLCVSPAGAVFPVPDPVSLVHAAVLGCSIFTAYGAVHQVARVQAGESVAVIAAGGIGLSAIHLARAAGADRVVAVDIDDDKLELARELGATHTINSAEVENAVEAIEDILGHRAEVVVEAYGSSHTARLAVDLCDDGGRVVLVGIAPTGHTLELDITKVVRRKIQILGSFGAVASEAMPRILDMAAAGELDLDRLITDHYAFDEIDDAYRHLDERRIRGRGVVVTNPELR